MSEKSEMGWVLQHMIDHGFCRDPVHRLAWKIGSVGFPIHFPGDTIECPLKTSANGPVEEVIPARTPIS